MAHLNRPATLAVKIVCLVAMAAGIAWNVRCALADYLGRSHESNNLRRAMRLVPANGDYAAQLADNVYAADPAFARSLLHRAVALNPYDAASWIQLGLLEEAGNRMHAAEQALSQAATADATYLPAWSLANYYFRRQNQSEFWHWARLAARVAPDDATPLFRLAWYVSPSVPAIEDRLQLQRPFLQSQFINFLIAQANTGAVGEAAAHLLAGNNPQDTPTVLQACDWLIAARHPGLALPLWNGLAQRHVLAYEPLNATDPVTNGRFAQAPTGRGFDWHMPAVEGVSSYLDSSPNALGFEFSGEQPDQFLLLTQQMPVEANKSYALLLEYETDKIPPASGFIWTVQDALTGRPLVRSAGLPAQPPGAVAACFTAPFHTTFIDLSLNYQRLPGTMRPEGKLALKQVRLKATAALTCPGG